jgi:hypothetical protein
MECVQAPSQSAFDRPVKDGDKTPLAPGLICVEHTYFCGKDAGLRFHVHPSGLDPRLLPAKTEDLTNDERIVLYATRSLKSSYNGVKDYRFHAANQDTGITRDRWEAVKTALIERKLLNKAGAITVDGKNAIQGMLRFPK